MSVSPLIPAAGAAGVFAAKAAKSLAGGLSFADVFRRADAAQPSPAQAVAEQSPVTKGKPAAGADPRTLLADFQERLAKKLAAAGIDLSQPIEISAFGDDRIQVSGENPDWPRIEQLLGSDSELRDAFNRLADAVTREAHVDRRQFKLTLADGQAAVSVE